MIILGIDPGSKQSGYVFWDHDKRTLLSYGIEKNDYVLDEVDAPQIADYVAIEQIRGYGIVAGDDTFDTCEWVGRFFQVADILWRTNLLAASPFRIPRKEIKRHLCGNTTTTDKYIRQALIDRYGEQGTKKNPGPLFGVSGHVWSALAVAVTCGDLYISGRMPA